MTIANLGYIIVYFMRVSSKNKKILIVSDVHQMSDTLTKILESESADIVVNLGDEYDSFIFDSNQDVEKMAVLHKKMLNNPNYINLLGNHTLAYHYVSNPTTGCSGYEDRKDMIINAILDPKDWDKVRWFCIVDDYLCTHGGLHHSVVKSNFKNKEVNLDTVEEFLNLQSIHANRALFEGRPHWFWQAGPARGAWFSKYPGILWQDFNEECIPLQIFQIHGHTPARHGGVRYKINKNITGYLDKLDDYSKAKVINVDCFLKQYLVITNGKIEVKNTIDL